MIRDHRHFTLRQKFEVNLVRNYKDHMNSHSLKSNKFFQQMFPNSWKTTELTKFNSDVYRGHSWLQQRCMDLVSMLHLSLFVVEDGTTAMESLEKGFSASDYPKNSSRVFIDYDGTIYFVVTRTIIWCFCFLLHLCWIFLITPQNHWSASPVRKMNGSQPLHVFRCQKLPLFEPMLAVGIYGQFILILEESWLATE